AEQTRKALDNVAAILRAAGSSLERVVQMTLLITDPADYREINAEYVKHFPGGLPARPTPRFRGASTAQVASPCTARAGDRKSPICFVGPLGRTLNVERLRLAYGRRAPPRIWTFLGR